MSDLPEPLVPPEVDLRDFPFFPVEFRRLFASETWILGNAEERCAALCLWCESWHGTPASSIPDNDRMLAHLSQSGARWPKVKPHVLRGWTKCSDGRLYHAVVAEKVLEAWSKHKKASSKGKAGASKRWGTGNARTNASANSTGIDQLMPNDSKGSGIGNELDKNHKSTVGLAPDASAAVENEKFNGYRQQAIEILEYLNSNTGRDYRPVESNLKLIVARLKSGLTPLQLREIVFDRCQRWGKDAKMAEFLRPATLFNATKCEQYLGEIGS